MHCEAKQWQKVALIKYIGIAKVRDKNWLKTNDVGQLACLALIIL